MARSEIYKCDACGAERTESNHWFLSQSLSRQNYGTTADNAEWNAFGISFIKWDDHKANVGGHGHLCGIPCCIKLLSTTAETWK